MSKVTFSTRKTTSLDVAQPLFGISAQLGVRGSSFFPLHSLHLSPRRCRIIIIIIIASHGRSREQVWYHSTILYEGMVSKQMMMMMSGYKFCHDSVVAF